MSVALPPALRLCGAAALAHGQVPTPHALEAAHFLGSSGGGNGQVGGSAPSVLRLARALPDVPTETLVRVRQELRRRF